uniref:Dynein light chain n=2 Tax=Eukaryota TaxID=2759 RepID=A0AA85JVE4_TRIRE|nr:unnamed protein product [Trichobilharzia regenti]
MGERKAVIKNADMNPDMQDDAVHVAASALDKFDVEKDVAAYIKKEFDRKYNPTWHCIVGRHFGRYVYYNIYICFVLFFINVYKLYTEYLISFHFSALGDTYIN